MIAVLQPFVRQPNRYFCRNGQENAPLILLGSQIFLEVVKKNRFSSSGRQHCTDHMCSGPGIPATHLHGSERLHPPLLLLSLWTYRSLLQHTGIIAT